MVVLVVCDTAEEEGPALNEGRYSESSAESRERASQISQESAIFLDVTQNLEDPEPVQLSSTPDVQRSENRLKTAQVSSIPKQTESTDKIRKGPETRQSPGKDQGGPAKHEKLPGNLEES